MMPRARRFWVVWMLSVLGCAAGTASGQTAANPTFEVASIKPNKSGTNQRQVNWGLNGRFTAVNVPLHDLIRFAYAEHGPDGLLGPLAPNQLSVAKTWAGGATALQSDKFDVTATADAGTSQEQVLLMLRALLAERFNLVVHRETKDIPIYALVMARTDGRLGPRLRPSNVDCSAAPSDSPPTSPAAGGFVADACKGLRNIPGKAIGRVVTIPTLARLMSGWVDDHRPVEDRTGLTGAFDIELDWVPNQPTEPPAGVPAVPVVDSNGAGLFTALQEQLGLKVQSTTNRIDILVVDHAEHPTQN